MTSHLIAFEGVDKSGKGTQSKVLAERLKGTRISFPRYETELGDHIRRHLNGHIAMTYEHVVDSSFSWRDGEVVRRRDVSDAMVFQCMMLADKEDAQEEIKNTLNKGHVVLDRYYLSALAYGAADGLAPDWLGRIHDSLYTPSVTFLIDVPVSVALARGRAAGDDRTSPDRYERDSVRMEVVRRNYLNMVASHGDNIVCIDGTMPVEAVSERVWDELTKLGYVR